MMNYNIKIDSVLLTTIVLVCLLLVYNVIRRLSVGLPYRVNCWSCNRNSWVKFGERNSWTCPKCDQYNGFTKDGDYNKPLLAEMSDSKVYTSHTSNSPAPRNGLCKKCNNDLQIKIAQLANFIPMNEKYYDQEIEAYNAHLEKSYALCKRCEKVLQKKLHREKEALLGAKLLHSRTQKKRLCTKRHKFKKLHTIMTNVSFGIERVLLLFIVTEMINALLTSETAKNTILYTTEVLFALFERIYTIAKVKIMTTFPILEAYSYDMLKFDIDLGLNNQEMADGDIVITNDIAQKALVGVGLVVQLIGHLVELREIKYAVAFDVVWLILCAAQFALPIDDLILCSVKMICIMSIFYINRRVKRTNTPEGPSFTFPPKRMKNLANGSMSSNGYSTEESEDDVSLSKLGVNTSSSPERSIFNNTFMSGRVSVTPSMWNKNLNSTFSDNSPFRCNSTAQNSLPKQSLLTQNNVSKQSLLTYQSLCKDDSDSDLDDSISCLNIGPRKSTANSNPEFALRRFTPMQFLAPSVVPLSKPRPLIMPSKLGHSTSWVAGGYWGADGRTPLFNINGSRSSSQSSGFESQTSSGTVQNMFSQPPSREESICGDPDRTLLARSFSSFNVNSPTVYQNHQSFNNSLVYPKISSDNYTRIPQSNYSIASNATMVNGHGLVQNDAMEIDPWMFKTPESSLLKPQSKFS